MGFLDALLSRTGPAKYGAAMNALTAKYMCSLFSDKELGLLGERIMVMLAKGGIPSSSLARTYEGMTEPVLYCFVSQALMSMNIQPVFTGEFFRGNWNFLANPFVALIGGSKELLLVQQALHKKYGVTISISENEKSFNSTVDQLQRSYNDFYKNLATKLDEENIKPDIFIWLGYEVPIMAMHDLKNMNMLLYKGNVNEVTDGSLDFIIEQSIFYHLYIARALYLWPDSDEFRGIATGYLNKICDCFYNNDQKKWEAIWEYSSQVMTTRLADTEDMESIDHIKPYYYSNCIKKVGLDGDYVVARMMLDRIIYISTSVLSAKLLPLIRE